MNWTKELPTEDGFYWYREVGDRTVVIEYDASMKSVHICGHDVPLAEWMGEPNLIEGEFLLPKLECPTIPQS